MILADLFRDKVFNHKLFSLAFPIALQSLMLALVAAADAFMLGKVSQDAMAAVSLATQIQFIQNIFLSGLAGGIGILGAQYWGKNDKKVIERIFGLSARESIFISLVFFAGCFFFPEMLMKIFADDPLLISLGAEYLRIAAWSYLLSGTSQCYLAIMRISEHAGRLAWISSGAVILNIILNLIFIFGMFGVPAMGIRGAALATVIARFVELLWCMLSTLDKTFIKLHIREIFRFDWLLIKDFWHYASPVLGAYLVWGLGFAGYTAIIGHMGRDAAAANSIATVVRDLLCCLCTGIAGGTAILIGNELGAGKLELGKKYGERLAVLSILTGFLCTILVLASIPLITSFITLTDQAHDYMVGMFIALSIYMIGRTICTIVINGVFTSGGDTLFDVYSLAVCMWGIALPCAFLGAFVFHLPVLVVFSCTCLDEVGKVPWVFHHFFKYKWVRNITRDFND